MNTHISRLFALVLALVLVLSAGLSRAEDNTTTTINGVTSNAAGTFILGNTGTNNSLVVTNSGLLINTTGIIGNVSTASYNTALVTGSGSVWTNTGRLMIGNTGSVNTLIISNGGHVYSRGAGSSAPDTLGNTAASSNNTVIITGSGSVWTNTDPGSGVIYLGNSGAGNSLILSDGGKAYKLNIIGNNISSSNNSLLVTGAGSLIANPSGFGFLIGFNGAGNQVTVTNGGQIQTVNGSLGGAASGSNNTVLVTGSGSIWNTGGGGLFVGSFSQGNTVTIANSGTVFASTAILGNRAGADNNSVLVTGAGSVWSNSFTLIVGNTGSVNSVVISNGAKLYSIGSPSVIGATASSSNNSVTVTGTGSLWTNVGSGFFYLGNAGAGNSLTIADGGKAYSLNIIGNAASSSNNTLLITGAGSLLANPSGIGFTIGNNGAGNQVIVTNGGTLQTPNGFLGFAASASNNSVLVTGSGSSWSTTSGTGTLQLGGSGKGNTLTVANSGTVTTVASTLGNAAGGDNNSVLVTGAASRWSITGALTIGNTGSFNSVTISDGGRIAGTSATVGNAISSSNNTVLITGANSVWTNSSTSVSAFIFGNAGAGNSMVISNGGKLYTSGNGPEFVGNAASSSNNSITITGTGSQWTNATLNGFFYLGNSGGNNSLSLIDGGQAFKLNIVGNNASSTNNSMLVSGAGSLLYNPSGIGFTFGNAGGGNRLTITNGGVVYVVGTGIGSGAGGGNVVLVTGPGSTLSNQLNLSVGFGSSDNSLTLANGASANSGVGGIFNLGGAGSKNRLVITNGATLFTGGPSDVNAIGSRAGGNNNSAIVTGAGSVWSNGFVLYVGNTGAVNSLTISDGGTVYNVNLVGKEASSSNNTVTITGAGSTLYNNFGIGFGVGSSGAGNQVIVTNGGRLFTPAASLGGTASSSNNLLVIAGPGSLFTNAINLTVGSAGPSNTLVISDRGEVRSTGGNVVAGLSAGSNRIVVTSGGVLEANSLTAGASVGNSISNVGGVYQFTVAAPGITNNGVGRITVTDGTISFRGVASADVFANVTGPGNQITNIAFAGNNTFRLNNSSNATGLASYVFNTGLGATNYTGLALMGAGATWRSTTLTIGSGGTLLASNSTATVAAALSSTGAISVVNSKISFLSNAVVAGSYISDPSTNTFFGDLTVTASGSLAGGPGDLFDFKKSLYINSTNRIGFNLASAAVSFTGGGIHTNAITGMDLGSNTFAYGVAFEQQTNFAYGELHLGSAADQICFECGTTPVAPSNALYIGWLDLLSNASLVTNLHAPSTINLYYYSGDTRNAYLGGLTYNLTDCLGGAGGLLMPVIPEPSAVLLVGLAALAAWRRRGIR
jgi:T5SS/PEP-CTERM-associated repeat protein